jgi:ribosomal protein S18 acetylase RimI-like enzyme
METEASFAQDMFHIRSLTINDLEAADQVLMSAYQVSSRRVELERLMSLERTTWLAGLEGDRLVGMVGAIDYGPFAYIGLMGIHADFQRRGYGKALMLALIDSLEQAGQPCSLLDASEAGAPLYARIGYRDLSLVSVYKQTGTRDFQPTGIQVERLAVEALSELTAFDLFYFGADRSQVLRSYLEAFPGRLIGARDKGGKLLGYALAQQKRLGPMIAADPHAAVALLEAAKQFNFTEALEILLPSPNQAGGALLESAGFVRQRTLRHMRRGSRGPERRLAYIYGQGSFMLG